MTSARYYFRCGDADGSLPDEVWRAQEWLLDRISEFEDKGKLKPWRAQAVRQHATAMPRAGYSFRLDDGTLVECRRVVVNG